MFINIVKYLLNNDINTVKADWAKYKTLSRTCRNLKKVKETAFGVLNEDGGCLKFKETRIERSIVIDYGPPGMPENRVEEYEETHKGMCDNFSRNTFCSNTDCPNFKKNVAYIVALNQYKKAMQEKETFLKSTLNHTK